VAVVAFHYTTRYSDLFGHTEPLSWNASWGHFGVDLFFMLSGFVILMTLERTNGWTKFAWGRFTRLYPAYWAAVAMTFVAVAVFGLPGQETTLLDALLNLTMVQSLLGGEHVDGAYWSLQAEVIFYANMLLIHRLGGFRHPLRTLAGWITLAAAAHVVANAAAAGWLPAATHHVSKLVTLGSLEFIPLFSLGMVIYLWRNGRTSSVNSLATAATCLAVITLMSGVATAAVAGLLALVLVLSVTGWLPMLGAPWLVYLGALSYPLYLTHQNIGYIVIRSIESLGGSPLLAIAAASGVAMVLAVALHHKIEQPSLQRLRGGVPAWFRFRRSTGQPLPPIPLADPS